MISYDTANVQIFYIEGLNAGDSGTQVTFTPSKLIEYSVSGYPALMTQTTDVVLSFVPVTTIPAATDPLNGGGQAQI